MSGRDKDPFDQHRTKGHGRSASAYDGATAGSGMSLPSPGVVSNDSTSLFDSGRTDSGFQSDLYLSGEISSPSYSSQRSREFDSSDSIISDSKGGCMSGVLDSGIDIGLSEHLSGLIIEESGNDFNDLNAPDKCSGQSSTSVIPNIKSNISTEPTTNPLSTFPWEIYFEQDEDGDTQLHIAIVCKFIEVVHCLITMVPDPSYLDIRNDDWQTPLHFAVLTGQPRIVRKLLCAGASADVLDMHGNTALHLAVERCDDHCVQALLQPISPEELQAKSPSSKHAGSNSARSNVNRYNYDGLACIHMAVMKRSINILKMLLWHGADINLREWKSGQTALHLAVQLRDADMLQFILTNCIDVDVELPTYAGLTAFQLAALQRTGALAHFLLVNGADNCPVEHDADSDDEVDYDEDDEASSGFHRGFTSPTVNGAINVSA